jgi:hypothetical protein
MQPENPFVYNMSTSFSQHLDVAGHKPIQDEIQIKKMCFQMQTPTKKMATHFPNVIIGDVPKTRPRCFQVI